MNQTYKKAKGSAGSKGVDFQVNLSTVFLLNALRQDIKDWKLSTENKDAGKFDDVVLELADGRSTLLQAKHKENQKITLNQILSTNSKNADFSLPKYFLSYLDVRTKIPVNLIIVCTNTHADPKILKFLNENNVNRDNILHYQDGATFYTFNDDIVADLITTSKVYHQENLKAKDIDESLITEENAKNFLKHFQLYVEYLSGNDMEKVTQKLLKYLKNLGNLVRNISYRDLNQKMSTWFKQPKGEYLTESRAKAMFCEIKSEKCCELLENYEVFFRNNYSKIAESNKRIFHIIIERGYLLHLMKVYRSLQQNNNFKILYASPTDTQIQIIKAFEQPTYTHLIIISPTFVNNSIVGEVYDILKKILRTRDYTKIIFVAERDNKLVQRMKSTDKDKDYEVFDECLSLEDVSEDTQEMLLNKKNIIFQEEEISLGELLSEQITDDYKKSIKCEILEKLVADEKLTVGKGFMDLEEEISKYYVPRNFEKIIENKEVTPNKEGILRYLDYSIKYDWEEFMEVTERKELISEEDICNIDDKIILISDSAGMGKTTVLKNLAITVKKKNHRLWVIRIELNQCTKILMDCLSNKKPISILELLNCHYPTRVTNELEAFLLSLRGIVVVMLDGIDEISPDYTELILDLLRQCQKEENLKNIFVTTRPHILERLKEPLNVTLFKLDPFTEQNQIEFLTRYWMDTLKLEDENMSKCERYASSLINKASSWIRQWYNDVKFIASPLHANMLAKVFLENNGSEEWQGLKEYLRGDEEEPKLPENKMNIAKLYEKFIEKKKYIFVERGNPNGNPIANDALRKQFDQCLAFHRYIALKTIFTDRQFHMTTFLSCNKENNDEDDEKTALKIGMVQKSYNEVIFIHRTFAEYFVAECILKELQLQNQDVEFQKLLIEEVLCDDKFEVIRRYLNNFLQNRIPYLSTDNFKSYKSCMSNINISKLIHKSAKEGNFEIFLFVLKLINYKGIKSKNVSFVNRTNIFIDSIINATDRQGNTTLHLAVHGDSLDIVKFLLENEADINAKNREGDTAFLAGQWGSWEYLNYFWKM